MSDKPLRFLYDFHVHTELSEDGSIRLRDIRKVLSIKGLDAIAVTDHDHFFGMDTTGIIAGQEMTCGDGTHIIGLFLTSELTCDDAEELIEEIHRQGGIACIPHLFRKETGLFANTDLATAMKLLRMADAIEVYNSKSSDTENADSLRIWDENRDLVPLSVSDAHYLFEVGNGIIASDNRITNAEELKNAYRRGELQLMKYRSQKKKVSRAESFLKKILYRNRRLFKTVRSIKHLMKTNMLFISKDRINDGYEDLLRIEKPGQPYRTL